MPISFDLNIGSSPVLCELNHILNPRPQLTASWTFNRYFRDQETFLLRSEAGKPTIAPATWGLSGDGDCRSYTDDRDPVLARRGVIFATAYYMKVPQQDRPWLDNSFRVKPWGWFAVGVSWAETLARDEFAVLTTSAGPDAAPKLHHTPVIVPVTVIATWLDPNYQGGLNLPKLTWLAQVERV